MVRILIYLRVCEFDFVKVTTVTDFFTVTLNAGTHHTADVDHLPNRGGVPWGALLNSSHKLGKSGKSSVNCKARANCKMEWILSPHFSPDLLNNNNDKEGFLVTTRFIKAGEELMWPYNVAAQSHRNSNPGQEVVTAVDPPIRPEAHLRLLAQAIGPNNPEQEMAEPPRRLIVHPRQLVQAIQHQNAFPCVSPAAPVIVQETECKCRTTCAGICINAPLPNGASRLRKARRND